MKAAVKLKNILNLFFILLVISSVASAGALLYFIFIGKTETNIQDENIDIVWSGFLVILFFGFTWGIYHLRKASFEFVKGRYFSNDIVHNFKKAGGIFSVLGTVALSIHLIGQLIYNSRIIIGMDSEMIGYLFILVIGVFLKSLSNVILEGQSIKNDNDLTI